MSFGTVSKICPICKTEFKTWPVADHKFCSLECSKFSRTKNFPRQVICENCNCPFMKLEKQIKRSKKHFCSWECHKSFLVKEKNNRISLAKNIYDDM